MRVACLLAAGIVAPGIISISRAALVTDIQDASFETPTTTTYTDKTAPGWSSLPAVGVGANAVFDNQWGARVPATTPVAETTTGFDGNQFMYVLFSGASQTLSDVVTPGNTYTLSVLVGARSANIKADTQPYTFQLLAGSTVLATSDVGGTPRNTSTIPNGTFVNQSITYTSPTGDVNAGQALTILLQGDMTSQDASSDLAFDNVRLDISPVPEPGSLALLGLGSLALLRRRARA